MSDPLDDLLPYATDRQKEIIYAIKQHKTSRNAAIALGVNERTITRSMQGLRRRADAANPPGLPGTVPKGFAVSGTSTLYDADGNTALTWVKTRREAKALSDALESVLDDFQCPAIPSVRRQGKSATGLLTAYNITDFHFGLHAWGDETGDDWDTEIAKRTLVEAVQSMIAGSPPSRDAVLAIMGDYAHWDGLDAVTPTSHNLLDADTRFQRLVDIMIDSTIQIIGMLLQAHQKVHVLICEGNHDIVSSVWLQKIIKHVYRNNRRVTTDDTPFPYYAHLHGKTMLCWHHGHKMKNENLPMLFATEPRYREMFGQATHTYIHTGHYHHHESKEHSGVIVERHPTLAARDAYAARGGWVSHRAAHAITYHTERGEVQRVTVRP